MALQTITDYSESLFSLFLNKDNIALAKTEQKGISNIKDLVQCSNKNKNKNNKKVVSQ